MPTVTEELKNLRYEMEVRNIVFEGDDEDLIVRALNFMTSELDDLFDVFYYELALTEAERRAVTWIGNRYWHGDDMKSHLTACSRDTEWTQEGDITYRIPEREAWEMFHEWEEIGNSQFDCFGPELSEKLRAFMDGLV